MNKILLICLFLASSIIPSSGLFASNLIKGNSLGEFASCDYYLIEDNLGDYTLVEWYGGTTTYKNDVIYGELHSYGFKDLIDVTNGQKARVWIDDYMLSQDRATEKLMDKCKWNKQILTYFDYSPSYTFSFSASPTANKPNGSQVATNDLENRLYCEENFGANSNPSINADGTFKCECKQGYTPLNSKCVNYQSACENSFGSNSIFDSIVKGEVTCSCKTGYKWDDINKKTKCISSANIVNTVSLTPEAQLNAKKAQIAMLLKQIEMLKAQLSAMKK